MKINKNLNEKLKMNSKNGCKTTAKNNCITCHMLLMTL